MNTPSVDSGDNSFCSEDESPTHTNGSEATDEDADCTGSGGSSSNPFGKSKTEEITERESKNVARLRYIFLAIKLIVVVVVALKTPF